jgi:hypothetical protein
VVQRKHCRSFYANEVLALGACSQPACHHGQPHQPPCRTRLWPTYFCLHMTQNVC